MRKKRMLLGVILVISLIVSQSCKDDVRIDPTITALNCSGITFSDSATVGVAYTTTAKVPYTGGNGDLYPTVASVPSTGVTGLSATIVAGQLANGSGTVDYSISGTPASVGTASFAIALGGQSCTINLPVSAVKPFVSTISATVAPATATRDTMYTGTATLSYTGGNGGAYAASSVMSTGVSGLTATRSAGMLSGGSGTLTYTISGTPTSTGTASFELEVGGKKTTISITVAAPPAKVATLAASVSPASATSGTAYTGVVTLAYTGGNGGIYAASSVSSTGVSGLTATLVAGTLLNGSGTLTYAITGTPASAGTAAFEFSFGSKKATTSIVVSAASN